MYVCIISFIYMYIEPIRMYVAVTSLLLFIPVESFYRYIIVNRIMLYSTLHTKRQDIQREITTEQSCFNINGVNIWYITFTVIYK